MSELNEALLALQEKVAEKSNMTVTLNHDIKEFRVANNRLEAVIAEDRATGEKKEWKYDGVFVFIGQQPNAAFVRDLVELDAHGFIRTGHELQHSLQDPTLHRHWGSRPPFSMETSVSGIFAAGDVPPLQQIVIVDNASSDGSLELLRSQYPEVKCIRSERNLGFAGGNNVAMRQARGLTPRFCSRTSASMIPVPTVGSNGRTAFNTPARTGLPRDVRAAPAVSLAVMVQFPFRYQNPFFWPGMSSLGAKAVRVALKSPSPAA